MLVFFEKRVVTKSPHSLEGTSVFLKNVNLNLINFGSDVLCIKEISCTCCFLNIKMIILTNLQSRAMTNCPLTDLTQ